MSKIKVKVSKRMASELNEALKENYCIESIYYAESSREYYERNVRSFYYDHYNLDYDYNKNKYKFLVVEYKDDCFAMNKYITTYDLQNILKYNNVSEFSEFVECLKREIEI